jgi:hypothetical protein
MKHVTENSLWRLQGLPDQGASRSWRCACTGKHFESKEAMFGDVTLEIGKIECGTCRIIVDCVLAGQDIAAVLREFQTASRAPAT